MSSTTPLDAAVAVVVVVLTQHNYNNRFSVVGGGGVCMSCCSVPVCVSMHSLCNELYGDWCLFKCK